MHYYSYQTPSYRDLDGAKPELDAHHKAVHYGVRAIQRRLDSLGFADREGNRLLVDGVYGPKTRQAVKWFQTSEDLASDGTVGPTTAQYLWRPLVASIGDRMGRPDLLWGMTMLESAGDPGAVSSRYLPTNGPDYGLCQINLHFNPTVTLTDAFSPPMALRWSANRLARSLQEFDGKGQQLQADCAVAYHNSPVQAAEWYTTRRAPSEQIENYVRLVMDRAASFH